MDLHSPRDRPFSHVPNFAVALGGTPEQTHIGVLYAGPSSSGIALLHLAFHHRLKSEAPGEEYCWAECVGFNEEERQQLAIWCNSIWQANGQRVPYGISFSSSPYFDSRGGFVPSKEGMGLTCATFVMALLRDYGFPVVNTDSWGKRVEDTEWQRNIVNTLVKHKACLGISDAHIEAQSNAIRLACRFKPEEVGVCLCLFDGEPVSYSVAEPAGKLAKENLFNLKGLGASD